MLEELKPYGLSGLEVYHSSNNAYESGRLREIARKHGLLISGGSDFHGAAKPDISVGTGRGGLRITEAVFQDIKKKRSLYNDRFLFTLMIPLLYL